MKSSKRVSNARKTLKIIGGEQFTKLGRKMCSLRVNRVYLVGDYAIYWTRNVLELQQIVLYSVINPISFKTRSRSKNLYHACWLLVILCFYIDRFPLSSLFFDFNNLSRFVYSSHICRLHHIFISLSLRRGLFLLLSRAWMKLIEFLVDSLSQLVANVFIGKNCIIFMFH